MRPEAPAPSVGELSADGTRVWGGRRWEPLWLPRTEIAVAVRACFGPDVNASATFMAEGLMNQSWRVEAHVATYVLRVSRSDLGYQEVADEHAVLSRLHLEVGEVVPALPGTNGETLQVWRGRLLSLFPYVHGVLGTRVQAEVRWAQSASALARIHRAGMDLGPGAPSAARTVLDGPTMWETVRPVLVRDLPNTKEIRELVRFLDAEAAELRAWMNDLRLSGRPLRRGVVHGDFNARNLIFDQDRLVAVIDWESCHVDVLAYEAALAVWAPDPLAVWRTYLESGGPLAPDDLDLLGAFARVATLTGLRFATSEGGLRSQPWAADVLRDVVVDLRRLRERTAEFGL